MLGVTGSRMGLKLHRQVIAWERVQAKAQTTPAFSRPTREMGKTGPEGRCGESCHSRRWPIARLVLRGQGGDWAMDTSENLCQRSLRGRDRNPNKGGSQGSGYEGRREEER